MQLNSVYRPDQLGLPVRAGPGLGSGSLTRSQSWASQWAGQFLSPQGWMARGLVSIWHCDSGTTRPSLVLQYTCLIMRPWPQLPLHCRGTPRSERGLFPGAPERATAPWRHGELLPQEPRLKITFSILVAELLHTDRKAHLKPLHGPLCPEQPEGIRGAPE